jgi:hypothetical protein
MFQAAVITKGKSLQHSIVHVGVNCSGFIKKRTLSDTASKEILKIARVQRAQIGAPSLSAEV